MSAPLPPSPLPPAGPLAPNLDVLRTAEAWLTQGHRVWMATVVRTYGSAPRPVGAMAVINELAQVAGSVSGGCVEDDLSDWLLRDAQAGTAGRLVRYGHDAEERARLQLPCDGDLEVWLEPASLEQVAAMNRSLSAGEVLHRRIDLVTGAVEIDTRPGAIRSEVNGTQFVQVLGPTFRLVLIGASEVSRYLAPIAMTLGFRVEVIDPRQEYLSTWPLPGCQLHAEMPDDVLAAHPPDARTAVVALSHDPKLDDLALIEALRTPMLYVGAMGSMRTTEARKRRLALFELDDQQLQALQGPVGADIGARTPPEIAIAIAADLVTAVRAAS